jgi:16S rRNA (uracil1498-N3)-methyltransferase
MMPRWSKCELSAGEAEGMAVHDFSAQRLFVAAPLAAGITVVCTPTQAHYLVAVLRLVTGSEILVFNGRDGEWLCAIRKTDKRTCELEVVHQTRAQEGGPDIGYCFAPLKRARLDYMVQKATELGVARLQPVLTQRTVAGRVNCERMRANVIEAAEQCGILRLPEVAEPVKFTAFLAQYPAERRLVMCDEAAPIASPIAALGALEGQACDVLIGPEGGFSDQERTALRGHDQVTAISLGPRIMRADTAAVAALSVLNSVIGDWR